MYEICDYVLVCKKLAGSCPTIAIDAARPAPQASPLAVILTMTQ